MGWFGFWIAVAAIVIFFDADPSLQETLVSYVAEAACSLN